MRSLLVASVLLCGSSALANDFYVRPDGFGGYRVYGNYYGNVRPDGFGGYRGQIYSTYPQYGYRQPHLQYNPFTRSYYWSYGARVAIPTWAQ